LYQHDPMRLYEVAHATGIATHRHPTADASAIGAAYLVKLALDGYSPLDMIEPTIRFLKELSVEFDSKLRQVREVVHWEDEEAALAALGEGGMAEEAVALALYCCARYPKDWVATVRRGANSSGDSDSVASIAGGIQAARLGVASLPQSWIERVERRDEIMQLADDLAQAKARLLY
ncbi:MAG: ADP-ribosylglycohydrolase family protein, partial [Ardenticatenales bacterium]|nr:ADP-ribosylglycohydrolase family protein [Ardenticatenales bacterium]